MIWTFIKWILPVTLIVSVAAAVLTRKTFHVDRIIAAPPEAIWKVLVDTSAYPEWNPVFVAVDGTYISGATVQNTVRDPSGALLTMQAKVTEFEPANVLRQKGGIPGVLTFDHQWLLEETDGGTLVTQHEVDHGIGLWFWNSDWIEPAYRNVLDALANQVARPSKSRH